MTELVDGPAGERSGLVQEWRNALRKVGSMPIAEADLFELLTELAGQLRTALVTEPFDSAIGRAVGEDLVAAGFGAPAALSGTILVMHARLPNTIPIDDRASAPLRELLASLASGFTEAVRRQTLDGQDSVRDAAIRAVAQAEREKREVQAALDHHTTHDMVTGLPNRHALLHRITSLLDAASPDDRLGLCCVDLDRFSAVSDALGHEKACLLLQAAAKRLEQLAPSAGWFLAHVESDQFAVVIEQTTCKEDATKIADRLVAVLGDPFPLGEHELPMTARAGVVEDPAAGDAEEWLKAAQTALHEAQGDRHARWRLFNRASSQIETTRYQMSGELPRALRKKEIRSFYQPLVDLRTGQVVGYEALARWHHPRRGLLIAGRFIDLAERTGMLARLCYQLLNQACQEAASWRPRCGQRPYLSVNLSADQLHQPGLVGHVTQTLDHTGLPPERLQLEISEQVIISGGAADISDAAATLRALDRLGVRLAVDDFGIGYSNVARLREMPLSAVKLDASLAQPHDASVRPEHEEFLAAVVALPRTLGLTVTAEGIESEDQKRRMYAAGCDTGQGWLFGRPVPAQQLRIPG